jgi:AcrR family transcriptional regulator
MTSARVAGRPRSAEAHDAILRAAIVVVREVGYDAAAMDAIAARAGVGKATVYRRWTSKEALVADAIEQIMVSRTVPDTGTTRGDLRAIMRETMRMYHDPQTTPFLSALVAAMARSEPIALAVRNGFVAVRRDAMRQVIVRGISRGDLRRGMDIPLALDLLSGPFLSRALITGTPIDERLVRGVVDAVLATFAP